jgi:hypothetical protein
MFLFRQELVRLLALKFFWRRVPVTEGMTLLWRAFRRLDIFVHLLPNLARLDAVRQATHSTLPLRAK